MASFSRILAIDIGASAIRAVLIAPDAQGRPTLAGLNREELSYDPAKSGELFPLLLQGIQKVVAPWGGKVKEAIFSMGGPSLFSRLLKIPVQGAGKVDQIIQFEAQQTVPAIEQALWDYQILPSEGAGETEALLLAIKKDSVEEVLAAAKASGLRPLAVDVAPASLLNAFFFNYPDSADCTLILDIGTRATNIVLAEGKKIFSRVVPLGGATVTQAVATDLQESFLGAETLKRAKGFVHPGGAYEDPPDAAAGRISKLARGVLTRLHTEIERSITFFRSQQGGGKPGRVLLAGGGSLLGLTDLFLQEKLRIPVVFFQPFRRLAVGTESRINLAMGNFPEWAVAVGAGLRALPSAPIQVNMLGAAARQETLRFKDRPARIGGICALALLLLLPGIHGFWQGARIRNELGAEADVLAQIEAALDGLEKENRALQDTLGQLAQADAFLRERRRWPRLLAELQQHIQPGMWITRLELSKPTEATEPAQAPGRPSPPPVPVLEITGMFETKSKEADARAVESFREALEKGGILKKVVLVERETPREVDGRTEQVALTFRLQGEWPLETPLATGGPDQGASP